MDCSMPGSPVHQQCPELAQTHVHWVEMPFNHLILCHPLLLLMSIFPRNRVFSSEPVLHIRWPKYWRFNFTISPSKEYSGLISFRMDWFDFPVVEGILKSLLQHHSWKASILQRSAFFIVQLSHPYMTTGKTIALTRQTFVGKVAQFCWLSCSVSCVQFFWPQSIFVPGKSHEWRSLEGYRPWDLRESDTTEWFHYTILWTVALQAALSVGFLGQEH